DSTAGRGCHQGTAPASERRAAAPSAAAQDATNATGSRGEPIRTADHSHPKRVRYLAAPRPAAAAVAFLGAAGWGVKAHVRRVTWLRGRRVACQLFDASYASVNLAALAVRATPRPARLPSTDDGCRAGARVASSPSSRRAGHDELI